MTSFLEELRHHHGAPSLYVINAEDIENSMSEHHHQEHQKKKELHIAPMLHYSTREFRQLMRILSKRAIVWTEMV